MNIEPFKMKDLTPEKSKIVQETLFKNGYKWCSGNNRVLNTDRPILFFYEGKDNIPDLSFGSDTISFSANPHLPELTFEEFKRLYVKKEETKLEVGKWYLLKALHLKDNWYIKLTKESPNYYIGEYCHTEYSKEGGFDKSLNYSFVELTDLSEIQQYLPDGHPDRIKVEKWSVGTYVVFTTNNSCSNNKQQGQVERLEKSFYSKENDCFYFSYRDGFANNSQDPTIKWFATLEEAEEFSKSLKSGIHPIVIEENEVLVIPDRVYNRVETITIEPELEALIPIRTINKIKI